jgi:hypothetical protein
VVQSEEVSDLVRCHGLKVLLIAGDSETGGPLHAGIELDVGVEDLAGGGGARTVLGVLTDSIGRSGDSYGKCVGRAAEARLVLADKANQVDAVEGGRVDSGVRGP